VRPELFIGQSILRVESLVHFVGMEISDMGQLVVLVLRDKVAVLQALASTVNRVSRNFRFLLWVLKVS